MSSCASSALFTLDPGSSRDIWIRAGMAAKAAGVSLEDFTEWSRQGANFAGEQDCANVWRSFKKGDIGPGTLFHMASAAGWKKPREAREDWHRPGMRNHPSPGPIAAESTPPKRGPIASVTEVWDRCIAATEADAYIHQKRGTPEGLRVYPASAPKLIIADQDVAGWLVVPALSLDGELRTLQLIPQRGRGKKLNLPGVSFGDGMFVVGNAADSARLFIAEGIGQAWACSKATGEAAIVTFGAGRMTTVAEAVRREYPAKTLVLVPDRGKEEQAAKVAKAVHGLWVELAADKPDNYDVNDLASDQGTDALAALLNNAKAPPARYKLLSVKELTDAPPLQWLVRGVLPAQGIAALYGASASGKSFLALDLAAAVASGADWFGCKTKAVPVVYLALEGQTGFTQRVKAWQVHHGDGLPDTLRFITQPFDLHAAEDLSELAEAVKASSGAGSLLIIDTLNRAASGADENSSQDMGRIIDAAKGLQSALGNLVLLIHHSGKDQTKGLRGHSSLFAALDAAIEVKRDRERRTWSVAKSKDESDGKSHAFRLQVVDVGAYEDGETVTSCAVDSYVTAQEATRRNIPKGGNQRIAWNVLAELFRNSKDFGKSKAPVTSPCVGLEFAITEIAPRLTCEDKRKNERSREAITGLVASNAIMCLEGWLWEP